MARIIGTIATSHTPTIGFALDQGKQDDPDWSPIFAAFRPVRDWLTERKPDVLLVIYNDHCTSFFFDHYSAFALGVGDAYPCADEGGGARDLPPLLGHAKLAHHIGASLVADEFDMSFFQDKSLDHGVFSPLSVMCSPEEGWPAPIVPLQVGVLLFPIPSARRCYKLGQALRRAIESYPEDLNVALIATGGMSHQVHGERAGFNDTAWDERFFELYENDPIRLTDLTQAEYATLGGMESSEIIMWLIARGAMSAVVHRRHRAYYLPSMTGIGTAIYENAALDAPGSANVEHRRHMNRQLDGLESLDGSYPFTLERCTQAYRLNKFLHELIKPEARAAFLRDQEEAFARAELSELERNFVRRRDWLGMIQYGVIFFVLEKLAAAAGISHMDVYAAMRQQTVAEFQASRNTKIHYTVAGNVTDAGRFAKG